MKQAFTSAAFLIATGVITFGVSQGCSSDKTGGFSEQADSGNADIYVPPPVGTDQPDSGDVIGDGCGGGNAKTEEPVTFLEFIADGSGSMTGTKRTAQEAALKSVFEDIKNKTVDGTGKVVNAKVGVGMIYFGDDGTYPKPDDVFVALVDGAQLTRLNARVDKFPNGLTPTYEALLGGYKALDDLVPFPPLPAKGKKIAILLSDGLPNGNGTVPEIYALVASKLRQPDPIVTFSVGVGELTGSGGYDPKFMAQVAVNGGTAKAGCDPNDTTGTKFCHFQITPGAKTVAQVSQEFVDAINEIRGLASDCEILLTLVDKDGKPADPTKVQVDFVDKD
ncbi:MAG: VWA domain-containing protein, partial [Polyangiaceae bacterium]|nr:VWA domain-containing protein [Polyangiaceae bacterium]